MIRCDSHDSLRIASFWRRRSSILFRAPQCVWGHVSCTMCVSERLFLCVPLLVWTTFISVRAALNHAKYFKTWPVKDSMWRSSFVNCHQTQQVVPRCPGFPSPWSITHSSSRKLGFYATYEPLTCCCARVSTCFFWICVEGDNVCKKKWSIDSSSRSPWFPRSSVFSLNIEFVSCVLRISLCSSGNSIFASFQSQVTWRS